MTAKDFSEDMAKYKRNNITDVENSAGTIEIDVRLIPAHVRDDLSRFALSLTKECFSQPGAEEECQEWLKNRKKAASVAKTQGAEA